MKILVTGATGFVGSEVVAQLVACPEVTQITCLSRRPMQPESLGARDSKVVTLLHTDFSVYDEALLARIADHAAVIWTLGGKASDFATLQEYARVTHGFAMAFAQGMASVARAPFSFCYLSGMGADRTESSRLPWERATRHLKGRTERDLLSLRRAHAGLRVYCFRPGGILPRDANPWVRRLLAPLVVGVEELAVALVRAATTTELPGERTFENAAIKAFARTATRAT